MHTPQPLQIHWSVRSLFDGVSCICHQDILGAAIALDATHARRAAEDSALRTFSDWWQRGGENCLGFGIIGETVEKHLGIHKQTRDELIRRFGLSLGFVKIGSVAIAAFALACGAADKSPSEQEIPAEGLVRSWVGFKAAKSNALGSGSCQYLLTYDRTRTIQISKTCPNGYKGTTNRIFSTQMQQPVHAMLLDGLEVMRTLDPLASYPSPMPYLTKYYDYDFEFLASDGNIFAVHIDAGYEDDLPAGLLQIYQSIADSAVPMTQNPNDAVADLIALDDETLAKTTLSLSIEDSDGGFGPGCSCDGNGTGGGYYARTKTYSDDGSMEQWSGCLRRATFTNDPNVGTRCHTDKVAYETLPPADWMILKRSVLSAEPLKLSESYPCGSYLDCPSDYGIAGLTIHVGQALRDIHWAAGEEAQLPASLQYILSVLP